jgi:dolichol-phosphate mannosyltransferase
MHIVAVIPTYNEAANIGPLLDALCALRAEAHLSLQVLVVDDLSPDGTAAEVRNRQTPNAGIHLLEAPRCGLGAAYVRGIGHALDTLAPDVLIQMDADFSHAPDDIPRLLQALNAGADLVVGSRYINGNRVPGEWGWYRRLLSRGGNGVARHWLGLAALNDCTAGFRVWRSTLMRHIQPHTITAQGYAFQVALLQRAARAGARIHELPVDFPERTRGRSKLGHRDLLEFAGWALMNRSARLG